VMEALTATLVLEEADEDKVRVARENGDMPAALLVACQSPVSRSASRSVSRLSVACHASFISAEGVEATKTAILCQASVSRCASRSFSRSFSRSASRSARSLPGVCQAPVWSLPGACQTSTRCLPVACQEFARSLPVACQSPIWVASTPSVHFQGKTVQHHYCPSSHVRLSSMKDTIDESKVTLCFGFCCCNVGVYSAGKVPASWCIKHLLSFILARDRCSLLRLGLRLRA
jgi:hypothetical protein